MKERVNNSKIKQLTITALFCALSFAVSVVLVFRIDFLTFDLKDSVSTICGMLFGPSSGLFCAVVVPFIEFATPTDGTGVYGLIMNLLSSIVFVGVSSLIYKYKKTILGAVVGLATAVCATVAVMMIGNIIITPLFMGVTQTAVIQMIPTIFLPFNLVKTVINASITMIIYKPISITLKRMGITKSTTAKANANDDVAANVNNRTRSILFMVISAIIMIVAFIVLFTVLGGKLA